MIIMTVGSEQSLLIFVATLVMSADGSEPIGLSNAKA